MLEEYQVVINKYIDWIRDNTSLRNTSGGEYGEITTPFLDRHNDHLEIYIKKNDPNSFILSDGGQTVSDLEMSGLEISSPKRKKTFDMILNGFGVKSGEGGELFVEAQYGNVAQKKHGLIQAMLAVNDMYSLTTENVASFFKEDVEVYFRTNNIFYTKDIKIAGKTGFDHNIDFVIPASSTKSERMIKVVNNPRKDLIMNTIFTLSDVFEVREGKTEGYVIYNDGERSSEHEAVSALKNYGISTMAWSERDSKKGIFQLT